MLKRKALDVAYLKDKDSGLKTFASFENKHDNTNITSEIVSVQSSKMSKASRIRCLLETNEKMTTRIMLRELL